MLRPTQTTDRYSDEASARNGRAQLRHVLGRGGKRRAWLRGRQNVHKRYLIHVARFNLGILMRAMFGQGTPREAASARSAILFVIQTDSALAIAVISAIDGETAMLAIIIAPDAA